jgi:zinc transporter ZupT
LYLGGLAGIALGLWFFARSRRPRPIWLVWTAVPTVIDVLMPWIGLPALGELPRMLLALAPGLVAGVFLALGVAELACRPGTAKLKQSVRAARA